MLHFGNFGKKIDLKTKYRKTIGNIRAMVPNLKWDYFHM